MTSRDLAVASQPTESCEHPLVRLLGAVDGAVVVKPGTQRELRGHRLIIGLCDANDLAAQLRLQQHCKIAGVPLLRVAIDVDAAWVGPIVRPDRPGCAACFLQWSRSRWPSPKPREHFLEELAWPAAMYELVAGSASVLAQLLLSPIAGPEQMLELFALKVGTSSIARHRFLPHPNCEECSASADDAPAVVAFTPEARTKFGPEVYRATHREIDTDSLIRRFVDAECGLVRAVREYTEAYLFPMQFAYVVMDDDPSTAQTGVGRTMTRRNSVGVAVLEAVERFCGFRPRGRRNVVRGSFAELSDRALDPRSFMLHDPGQAAEPGFQLVPYDDNLQFDWTWGYSFRRREPVLVPQQLVYYRLPSKTPEGMPTNRFVYESSNGCALGGSPEEAVLHGLFEVLERDAFFTTWYGSLEPVELDLSDTSDRSIAQVIARAESMGFSLHVFDVSVGFSVTTIMATIIDRRPDAIMSAYSAAAAHCVPEEAILSALIEVVSNIVFRDQQAIRRARERGRAMFEDASLVQSQEDHIVLFAVPETLPRLDFLFQSGRRVPTRERFKRWYEKRARLDLTNELLELVAEVREVADDVVFVDQTFSSLRERDLHCVKVLAPGLHTVTFGHQYRRVSIPRIHKAMAATGRRAYRADYESNRLPHNFP